MPISARARREAAPPGDIEMAQTYLFNVLLKAKRRLVHGESTQAEYDAVRRLVDEAQAPLRLLAIAMETPHLDVITYERGRR